ncbi:MAG: hypothetical protein COA33_012105 [Fluviicola sp.]|nr:hypothetical protein [Fluviicola sp.]
MKNTLYILTLCFSLLVIATSCKKEENKTDPSVSSSASGTSNYCYTNQGKFSIDVNGVNHTMVTDATTNFTIIHNWYGLQETNFLMASNDQNGNFMAANLVLPNEFSVGSTTYSSLDFDYFDISVDTLSLYVSNVTFTVASSNLNTLDGIYRPVSATFTGFAHSYPWTNGQAPIDTFNISGSFCLNGFIIP